MPGTTQRYLVNVRWLMKLRWVAVVGQLITIIGAMVVFKIDLTLWPLLVVIGLTVFSNLLLMSWSARAFRAKDNVSEETWNLILALVMTMDMLSLTTLLYATGGPTNPFTLFFFVNLSLCAVVLDRNSAWALNFLSVFCFGWLLYHFVPIGELDRGSSLMPISQRGSVSLAHLGLLVSFATCSSVIVYFMTRVTGELREREIGARLAQQQQLRSEKLEALGTLAAGAAHELSTPLTTIALVAKDVEKAIERQETDGSMDSEVVDDVRLIRVELDRCKKILDRMASHSGQTVGEMMQRISLENLWDEVVEGLPDTDRIHCMIPELERSMEVNVPVDALSQALRGLVQNSLQASDDDAKVEIFVQGSSDTIQWQIHDRGCGMTPDILNRVSEPFFTTKQPGKGMGLGVFLAKNVVEWLDGQIHFESQAGKGTVVSVRLPRAKSNQDVEHEIDSGS